MKNFTRQTLLAASVAGLMALTGCGPETETAAPAAAPDKAEAAAPVPQAEVDANAKAVAAANASSLLPRYAATLAEGIDFAKPGYPEFVVEASGISGAEAWGRWSDANLGPAKLRFRDPLPQRFTLQLKVRDFFGLNAQQKISVRVGTQEQGFILLGKEDQVADLVFEGFGDADSIEISIPKTTAPSASDSRRIGLGLISLSIRE